MAESGDRRTILAKYGGKLRATSGGVPAAARAPRSVNSEQSAVNSVAPVAPDHTTILLAGSAAGAERQPYPARPVVAPRPVNAVPVAPAPVTDDPLPF